MINIFKLQRNNRFNCSIVVVILLLNSIAVLAQESSDFPLFETEDLTGSTVLTERSFTSESLFGYMNGGAELYLEYGFDRLVVSEIDYEGLNFKVEIFKMKGKDEAFGIYSVSVFRCDRESPVSFYSCISQYQVQFCKGDYYVNVINNSGSRKGLESSEVIAEIISDMISGDSFDAGNYLAGYDISAFSKLVLVKGELGLYNGASDWEGVLGGLDGCTAIIAFGEREVIISVVFDNPDKAMDFYNSRKDIEPAVQPGNQITFYPEGRVVMVIGG